MNRRKRKSKLNDIDVMNSALKIINGERYINIESKTGFKRSTVCYNINRRLQSINKELYEEYIVAVKEHVKNKIKKEKK